MDCCQRSHRRVIADTVTNIENETSLPHRRKVNGWSKPFHYLQVVPWALFLILILGTFCVFIPMLACKWQNVIYAVTSGIFLLHLIANLITITIDPAEANVRLKMKGSPQPVDGSQQIYNDKEYEFCRLCDTIVSVKSKHCRACNKCVSGFDHHCKWLNNCVGSRNYCVVVEDVTSLAHIGILTALFRWFFSSVASAFNGALWIIAIVMNILIQHWVNPDRLRMDPHYGTIDSQDTWLLFLPFFPVRTKTPVVVSIEVFVLLLAIVILVVLGYLLCFHMYLLYNGFSTFEYLKKRRDLKTSKASAPQENLPFEKQADTLPSCVHRLQALASTTGLCFALHGASGFTGSPRLSCDTVVHPSKDMLTEVDDNLTSSAPGMKQNASQLLSMCSSLISVTVISPETVLSTEAADDDLNPSALGMKQNAPKLLSRCSSLTSVSVIGPKTKEPAQMLTRSAPELSAWLQPEWIIQAAQGRTPGEPGGPKYEVYPLFTSKELGEAQGILKVWEPSQAPKQVYQCWTEPCSQAGQGQTRTHASPIYSMEFSSVSRVPYESEAGTVLSAQSSSPEDSELQKGVGL